LELLVAEDDVTVLLVLVALHDLVVGDLFLVDGAHPLTADPAVVGGMELVELEALLLDGREQADRDADEAERDGPVPDGSHGGHGIHDTSVTQPISDHQSPPIQAATSCETAGPVSPSSTEPVP